jgi:hypothetical protein
MLARRSALAAALIAALAASGAPSALAAPVRLLPAGSSAMSLAKPAEGPSKPALADDRVLVQLKGPVTADKLTRVYQSADTSAGAVRVVRGDTLAFNTPSDSTPQQFAKQLVASGEIKYASPNYVRYPTSYTPPTFTQPNDPAYTSSSSWAYRAGGVTYGRYPAAMSWWIRDVRAVRPSGTSAWPIGYTGSSITGKHPLRADGSAFKVAVIDTGLYSDHPDVGTNIQSGSGDATPLDPSLVNEQNSKALSESQRVMTVSHGTCVAGEIAATANNGIGTLGVAGDTEVRVYKVYGTYTYNGVKYSGIQDSDIVYAIMKAADDGCRVINMSLAGPDPDAALQAAIDYAYGKGCVIVAASGNNGSAVEYPAACNHVIAVGALGLKADGTTRKRSSFSSYGSRLDLMAPGEFVLGLSKPNYDIPGDGIPDAGYTWWDGTSMASPIVAGGIAWLWRAVPDLTNAQITSIVQSTARDLGAKGRDNTYGYGELDMTAAYARLISDYPLLKKPMVTVKAATNTRDLRFAWSAVKGFNVTYNIDVDGTRVLSKVAVTSATLPRGLATGPHIVTISPASHRNWADGTEAASVQISPTSSLPFASSLRYYRGKLLWNDSESGLVHTDLLSIDGSAAIAVSHGSTSTAGLTQGTHVATLTVRDADLVDSDPANITFTVRETPSVTHITATDAAAYAVKLSTRRSSTATTAVLVGTTSWSSAAVAAPLARVVDGPVLATGRTAMSAAAKTELARLHATSVLVVGPTSELASGVMSWLATHGYSARRIAGSDAYATADAVASEIAARQGGTLTDGHVVVVGNDAADALSASAVGAAKHWPLLMSRVGGVPAHTRTTLTAIGVSSTLLVARTSTVSGAAKAQLPGASRIGSSSSAGNGTALAEWAISNYPADFPGEHIFLINPARWNMGIGLPAAAARENALVLTTGVSLAPAVKSYYSKHSEVAVRTRVLGTSTAISNASVTAIRKIVEAN